MKNHKGNFHQWGAYCPLMRDQLENGAVTVRKARNRKRHVLKEDRRESGSFVYGS